MRSIQGVLSEVAYLERSCQYVKDSLKDVDKVANAVGEMSSIQESGVEAATRDMTALIQHHLEAAASYAEQWKSHIENIAP
ncbi:hypothetical protein [Streptomyces ipomoeae]|uniref:Uncharacterized protein n=1 Tax=Streptomyces ipomoeae 91-03 TaxID=698759 RepID=L1KJH6_9ACTN|nr:hypothetical protein [Streptomyces ipomoeae]EKX60630.1 hypothetical protein STRIP9103_01232 [Streptomyces ipomoeae 91-03]MDX2697468.1 hypothetical protein [Streptomyces ipomoeae]MDX2843205.1 hypothetical protein [Streptomyces ipomoeae]